MPEDKRSQKIFASEVFDIETGEHHIVTYRDKIDAGEAEMHITFDFPDLDTQYPHWLKWYQYEDNGSNGKGIYWVEVLPEIRTVWWPDSDTDSNYGTNNTKRFALPYLEFFSNVKWQRLVDDKGKKTTKFTSSGGLNSVYFRNSPAHSMNDNLKMAALKNVSVSGRLQGWFCLLGWRGDTVDGWWSPVGTIKQHSLAITKYAYHSTFNLSSERSEGFSWYEKSRDAGIISTKEWTKLTENDPSSILQKNWLDIGMKAIDVIDIYKSGMQMNNTSQDNRRARLTGYTSLITLLTKKFGTQEKSKEKKGTKKKEKS